MPPFNIIFFDHIFSAFCLLAQEKEKVLKKNLPFLDIFFFGYFFFTCGASRAMKNLHIICTKMLLGWRDFLIVRLGVSIWREKFERILQRKAKNKITGNGNYFISIIVLVSSKKTNWKGRGFISFFLSYWQTEKLGISDWKTHSRALARLIFSLGRGHTYNLSHVLLV